MVSKRLLTLALAATGLLAAGQVAAQPSEGEVTKVDRPAARVTLKHNGVKSLGMPAMTMSFRAADPKVLDGLAVGDRVRFEAQKVDGSYLVTTLQKAN